MTRISSLKAAPPGKCLSLPICTLSEKLSSTSGATGSLFQESQRSKSDRRFLQLATAKETNTLRKERASGDSKARAPKGDIGDHFRVAGIGIGY